MKKKALMIAGTMLLMMFTAGCGKREEVNLNDYVNVEYEGYDSMGTAVVTFDYKALKKDFKEVLELTKDGEKEREDLEDEAKDHDYGKSVPELLAACLDGNLDNTDDLSNGDTITFVWDIDEEQIERLFKCDIVYSEIEFEVDSLEEVPTVDLFEGVNLSFTGTSPFVDVRVDGFSSDLWKYDGLSFRLSPDSYYGLKNGDTIKIVAEVDGESDINRYFIENYEVVPEALEMEFTVEGLGSYVMSASELSEETLDKMKEVVEDEIASYVAPWNTAKDRRLVGSEFIGTIIRTRKEGVGGEAETITLIYRCDCALYFNYKRSEGYFEEIVPFYFPVTFKNVTILPDGTQSVNLSDHSISYDKFNIHEDTPWLLMDSNSFDFKGYEDLDSLFSKYVTENLDRYDYEDTVHDTEIPEYPDAFDFLEEDLEED